MNQLPVFYILGPDAEPLQDVRARDADHALAIWADHPRRDACRPASGAISAADFMAQHWTSDLPRPAHGTGAPAVRPGAKGQATGADALTRAMQAEWRAFLRRKLPLIHARRRAGDRLRGAGT